MDFLGRLLSRKPKSGGGGGTTPALPPSVPPTPLKSEHEANVEFAREFVVELVEKVPKREKESIVVKPVVKEDVISLKSASEASFQTLSSAAETVSLPDLLQPESVYKKQTDTDTDTAEYESAGDTDPLNSPIGSVLLEDILNSFEEALDKKQHSETTGVQVENTDNTNDSEIPTPSEVSELQDVCSTDAGGAEPSLAITIPEESATHSEVSTFSETYEDAKSFEKDVNPLNLSDLCVQIEKLNLGSPTESQNSNSDLPSNSLSPVVLADFDTSEKFSFEETVQVQKTDQVVTEQLSSVQLNTSKQTEANCEEVVNQVQKTDQDVTEQLSGVQLNTSKQTEVNCEEVVNQVPKTDQIVTKQLSGVQLNTSKQTEANSEEVVNQVQKTDQIVTEQLSSAQLNTSKQTETNCGIKEVATCDESLVSSSKTEIELDSSSTTVPDKHEDGSSVKEEVLDLKNVKNEGISEVAVLADSSYIVANNLEPGKSTFEHGDSEFPIKEQVHVAEEPSNQKTGDVIDVKADLISSTAQESNTSEKESENEAKQSEKSVVGSAECSPESTASTCNNSNGNVIDVKADLTSSTVQESNTSEKESENEAKQSEKSAVGSLGLKDLSAECSPNSTASTCNNSKSSISTNDLQTTDILQESCSSHAEEDAAVLSSVGEQTVTNFVSSETSKSLSEGSTSSHVKRRLTQEFIDEPAVQVEKKVGKKDSFASSDLPDAAFVQDKDLQCVLPLQNSTFEKVEHIEKQESVTDEPSNELSELIALCSRQQKDLELGDEKFVDGKEFFSSPSFNECEHKSEKHHPSDTLSCVSDFDKSITEEAEKVLQEIINSSELEVEEIKSASGELVMAEPQEKVAGVVDESGVNPFVNKSGIKRSPPTSRKSPRQSQNQTPAASPRSKSRHSGSPARVVSETNRNLSRDASPRSQHSVLEKTGSIEGSLKNSAINSEINHSEAGPDIAEDAPSGDVFKDPSAFEYLNSVGNSQGETDLRKESLYVKFDPLVGAVSKTGSMPLPAAVEAKGANVQQAAQEVSSPVKEQHCVTPTKNPAISFIDKLISLSPSPLKSAEGTPIKQAVVAPVRQIVETPTKQEVVSPANLSDNRGNEHAEMLEELYLLRELLAKQDEHHKVEIANLRSQIAELQARLKESEEREVKLNKKVAEKAQGQKQMSIIMEEYEKTISRLVAEKEQERHAHEIDKENIIKERDAAMGHLGNIEIAFSDVHKKYERSKAVIEGFKKNEEVLRASLAEYEATIRKQEQKYEVLKSHAMSQLESANQELEAVRRSQQAETAKLKAMLKKAELKTTSLEEMLEQKVKENQELASICDELINKVGSSD